MKQITHRSRIWLNAILGLTLLGILASMGITMLTHKQEWWNMIYPFPLLLVTPTVLYFVRNSVFKRPSKKKLREEDIEANRIVGITYQGKGMLDMAFEKFRQCPVDNTTKPLLYDLAGDYEKEAPPRCRGSALGGGGEIRTRGPGLRPGQPLSRRPH